ncbi:TonB-dependent receptor [Phocaeicola vulgatus]|uniref:TonB-dependent receptor n=1 Tax=Phocaeicola vulgatus TaxID=821 RepID=A0A848R0Y0_PHOVU|nr:carboxypeptidase regulatory-like domain-containing protein [Phocaeicola vulgatus]NMW41971.1 TonB-dependent receptor [Phocaeicola vulgatus]
MVKRMRSFFAVVMLVIAATVNAQVTTSSMSGKVVDQSNEAIIGATIQAIHEPSGTHYGAITNVDGRYSIQGMRAGGPYKVEVSYVGYQSVVYKSINLQLGENYVLDANLKESTELLDEVVITASKSSNMKSDRAGAVTNVDAARMSEVPTVSRSMNDIMRLTPQGANIGSGFSVGGGNYRQSYVTVDGAAFNNAFGIGSNLPAGGSPISLDALEQISVSTTPFDVRQSGFTGGAINAVTKSGTNEFKGTAYMYTSNTHLTGNKVEDYELTRNRDHSTTYGASLGGAIIKNKLFFFVNGEYQDNVQAGPSGIARSGANDEWSTNGIVHRPFENTTTVGGRTFVGMNNISQYLSEKYNYNPGRYQGYSLETPSYKIMGRLDWNINNNKINFRFTHTHSKYSSNPSSSTTPFKDSIIYPGGVDGSAGKSSSGRTANAGMYFESSRYMQEQNFTSIASEWNSKWGAINNALRFTYSYQNEPRTYEGGTFPTVDILDQGSLYASFGPDPFTEGNLRQVKTFVITDEFNFSSGIHNFMGGIQFESNKAVNGFMQAGSGYYVYSSWDDFVNNRAPAAFGVTYSNTGDGSQFLANMKYQQLSFYLQDQMNITDNFRLTAGVRFELPIYPELKNNYNKNFAQIDFDGYHYATDQLPSSYQLTASPRIGFNWDLTGERKYVLRGGSGYFIGRLPFVWLVSAVGNANCGQSTYYYNEQKDAKYGQPSFHTSVADMLKDPNLNLPAATDPAAPSGATIIDRDLKMNATWKSSLAFDAKLPGDIDFTLEGIFSKEFNPATVTNLGRKFKGEQEIAPGDVRRMFEYSNANKTDAYYITNAGNSAYYYSLTASLAKTFDFGLHLSASYTRSYAKSYGDGIGDQVNSAYYNNRYSVNGNNDTETGYGTYVSPNRVLASAAYRIKYAKNFASSLSLIYEGMNMGYAGGYSAARYSYTFTGNIVGDYGSNNLLYIPASREALDKWNFTDYTDSKTGEVTYSAKEQRDDFWAYINEDSYLKGRKGKYAERGGAIMPWHHQLDLKFNQDFFLNVGGKRNTLQFGVDIKNFLNLLNSDWGIYKTVNNTSLLSYKGGAYQFQKNGGKKLTDTYSNLNSFNSTYSIQFSVRYIFN